jgi:hypothetical protein
VTTDTTTAVRAAIAASQAQLLALLHEQAPAIAAGIGDNVGARYTVRAGLALSLNSMGLAWNWKVAHGTPTKAEGEGGMIMFGAPLPGLEDQP